MTSTNETGHISIHAENILPIIKKWLYSEKEIFIRELVANASDAIFKLSKIALTAEPAIDVPEARISISVNKEQRTLTIEDSGVGLTADEVKKYINQVAFSGVKDFVEKYQGKDDDQQIIGHFGLGFYSSYMVATKVEIDSLSYQQGAAAVHWSCDGSTQFEMSASTRSKVGTAITLHIADDSSEMLDQGRLESLLRRYCAFVRYPIYLGQTLVNDPTPLWTKSTAELNEKDYLDFFHKLFPGSPDPLFWIHLNVDFPFKLKGILYFPRLRHELDASQGEVKLYCNQVFVADNCKELIPEFLTLLKGAVDCPDLPLNVSRSYLQNDQTVQLISQHISKKVADKLVGMAKTDTDNFQKYWDDIHAFVKFGMLKDQKFYERMIDYVIYRTQSKGYLSFSQYSEKMAAKTDNTVVYATDEASQGALIRMLQEADVDVLIADALIDLHFLPYVEMQSARKWRFVRVDADLPKHIIDDAHKSVLIDPADQKSNREKIEELFRTHLHKEKVKIRVEALKTDKISAVLTLDEQMRRVQDMTRAMARGRGAGAEEDQWAAENQTLVINENSAAVKNLLRLGKMFNRDEEIQLLVQQVYDLALLQQGELSRLSPHVMQTFLDRSAAILAKLGSQS